MNSSEKTSWCLKRNKGGNNGSESSKKPDSKKETIPKTQQRIQAQNIGNSMKSPDIRKYNPLMTSSHIPKSGTTSGLSHSQLTQGMNQSSVNQNLFGVSEYQHTSSKNMAQPVIISNARNQAKANQESYTNEQNKPKTLDLEENRSSRSKNPSYPTWDGPNHQEPNQEQINRKIQARGSSVVGARASNRMEIENMKPHEQLQYGGSKTKEESKGSHDQFSSLSEIPMATSSILKKSTETNYSDDGNKNSQISSKIGPKRVLHITNEYTYSGEIEDRVYSGKGTLTYPDYTFFEGCFENGKRIKGTLFDVYGQVLESGKYNADEKLEDDTGILYKEGELFQGVVTNGQRNGEGIQYYANSSNEGKNIGLDFLGEKILVGAIHLKGCWKNDKRHGKFEIYDPDGKFLRAKEFENGEEVIPKTRSKIRIIESEFEEGELKPCTGPVPQNTSICTPLYILSNTEINRLGYEWLSSNNLNFYIEYLMKRYSSLGVPDSKKPKVLVLTTVVDEYMKKNPPNKKLLQNYTKRYTLPAKDSTQTECQLIFDVFDRILFPITLYSHWTLAEINCQNKDSYKLFIYDSLSSWSGNAPHHTDHLGIVKKYIKFEVEDKCKNPDLVEKYLKKCPKTWSPHLPTGQQKNGSDCGVFVLGFIQYILENKELSKFTQSEAKEFRKHLIKVSQSELGKGQ